jgi:DNA-binding transcriptional regulator YiaG
MKKNHTNWNKLMQMSEVEIERNAIDDDDSYVATREELMNFKSIEPVKKINVKEIRKKMGFSQHRFSAVFGFSMRTLQEWEQGRREPHGAVKNFLKVIERNPKAVQHALLNEIEREKDV